jgi:hypothetical protein
VSKKQPLDRSHAAARGNDNVHQLRNDSSSPSKKSHHSAYAKNRKPAGTDQHSHPRRRGKIVQEEQQEEETEALPSSPAKPDPPVLLPPPGVPLLPCQMKQGSSTDEQQANQQEMKYLGEGYLKMYRGAQPPPKLKQKMNEDDGRSQNKHARGSYLQAAMSGSNLPAIDDDKRTEEKKVKRGKKNASRCEVSSDALLRHCTVLQCIALCCTALLL